MAYNIVTTSGFTITSILDGTVNSTATSLTLVGKNYAGYGIFLNENYVKLLENFAYDTAPASPLIGQIWYDSSATLLKFYTGTAWKPIHTSVASSTSPNNSIAGDLWWNTATAQLFVYSGSQWVLIGPLTSTGTGTSGPAVETILDNVSGSHVIVRFYVSNATVMIISKDAQFTPQTAISGFATLKPGMNLSTTITDAQLTGNASNALALAGLTASQFLRSDQNTTTSSTFSVLNNTGLTIGGSSNFNIGVVSGDVKLYNQISNSDINLHVNMGGSDYRAINIDGGTRAVTVDTNLAVGGYQAITGNLNVTGWTNVTNAKVSTLLVPDTTDTTDIGTSSLKFNNIYANNFVGNVTTTSPATLPSITKSGADGVGNIASPANRFNTVHAINFIGTEFTGHFTGNVSGTAMTANYADLAERFETDTPLTPGTVVELGGFKEITTAIQELSENVFGVISTLPGFLLNGAAGNDVTHPPVAVSGRVPVRVVGVVAKGDRLVNAGNGVARAATRDEITAFNVIGRAVGNKTTTGEGTVEAIVKLNN